MDSSDPDTAAATNLFTGLFGAGAFACEADLERAWKSWREAQEKVRGFYE